MNMKTNVLIALTLTSMRRCGTYIHIYSV